MPVRLPQRIWLFFGFAFPAILIFLSFEPRWQWILAVTSTLRATGVVIAAGLILLLVRQQRTGLALAVEFRPLPPHYVQALLQLSIFAYWGWYWRPVYEHAGLIVAQVALAYGLDMLLSLARRRSWTIGFGPFPIVFSTNLFLLFRPEWIYLQFVMIAVGIFGKEFIRWNRDGKSTHIFNPSAFSLFVFSIILIVTNSTQSSFGQEIAITLNQPPHIYVHIFLLGLVVQFLFSVTLVTLASVLALIGLNMAYTGATGTYFFIDSNIPIAVFLGLHLLVTDPATSPRTAIGKAFFGVLYGSGVFLMYGLLGWLGVPTFYDKLLCVPILNLLVPWIDAMAHKLRPRVGGRPAAYSEISPRANRVHMLIWIVVFSIMFATSWIGPGHPGNEQAFWQAACRQDLRNGCQALFVMNRNECRGGDASACIRAADVFRNHPQVAESLEEGHLLARGCDLGNTSACDRFRIYLGDGGKDGLDAACRDEDLASCFIAGLVEMFGTGVAVDVNAAIGKWTKACEGGWARACGFLGETYLLGRQTVATPETAAKFFTAGCDLGYQPSCTTLGLMYLRGHGVDIDGHRGQWLLRRACASGWQLACNETAKMP
jgi:hypothetical protein